MQKTWIDENGHLRIKSENHALVVPGADPLLIEDLMLHDSWDAKTAAKIIVFGYDIDFQTMLQSLKDCPPNTTGYDQKLAMVSVYSRACAIAESSIKAGMIGEHDTPTNWIAWARRKGYSVEHLDVELAISNLNEATKATDNQDIKDNYQGQLERLHYIARILANDTASSPTEAPTAPEASQPMATLAPEGKAPETAEKHAPLQRAQEDAILGAIIGLGYTPDALPSQLPGKSGVKAEVRKILRSHPLFKEKSTVFDKAWERLREFGDIADE